MREKLSLTLAVTIAIAFIVGILSVISLGISTVTGFPFWFGFIIAVILLISWVATLDEDGL